MNPEIERFLPVAGLLVAVLLGFIYDVATGNLGTWAIVAPIGLLAGFGVKFFMRSKHDAG